MSDSYEAELEAQNAARVARLRTARGWLSLVGKIFLAEGTVSIGSAEDCGARLPAGAPPRLGTISVEGGRARFDAAEGADVRIDGERVTRRELRSDAHGAPDSLVASGFVLELMERGDSLALRVRDVRELPRPFAGIARFPMDRALRITAHFVPHDTPQRIAIEFEGATDGAAFDTMSAPGILVFETGGVHIEMDALLESGGSRLYVPFRDATSGNESYGPGRFLYAAMPDAENRVVIDFNTAMLPGCAFSMFATCPIPPPRNRLKVPIRAGETFYEAEPVGTP